MTNSSSVYGLCCDGDGTFSSPSAPWGLLRRNRPPAPWQPRLRWPRRRDCSSHASRERPTQHAVLRMDPSKILALKLRILGPSEGCGPPTPPPHTPPSQPMGVRAMTRTLASPRRPEALGTKPGLARAAQQGLPPGHASATLTLPYRSWEWPGPRGPHRSASVVQSVAVPRPQPRS